MASAIQRHIARYKRISSRIEKLTNIRQSPPRFYYRRNDGYKCVAAEVGTDGQIILSMSSLDGKQSRDLGTWILEMHAGHIEPKEEEAEP